MRCLARCLMSVAAILVTLARGWAAHADPTTSIVAIADDPDAYDGAQVGIAGVVGQQSLEWKGVSLYTLDEGGRRITVLSDATAPALGSRLEVSGQVVVHPEGKSEIEWPPVVVEGTRSVVP